MKRKGRASGDWAASERDNLPRDPEDPGTSPESAELTYQPHSDFSLFLGHTLSTAIEIQFTLDIPGPMKFAKILKSSKIKKLTHETVSFAFFT